MEKKKEIKKNEMETTHSTVPHLKFLFHWFFSWNRKNVNDTSNIDVLGQKEEKIERLR